MLVGSEIPFGQSGSSCIYTIVSIRRNTERSTHTAKAHAHTPEYTHTYPVCVVDDNRVRVPVVGWICIWVIAEPGQHGGNLGHVPHHISRDVASPLGEGFQVHGFDDLVCGPLDPGERAQSGQVVGCSLMLMEL